jgi:hypothetical protein
VYVIWFNWNISSCISSVCESAIYRQEVRLIKNKSHKDSVKILLKLAIKKINQIVNLDAF